MKPKITYSRLFVLLAVLSAACLITANIIAVKIITLFGFFVSGGIVVFPIAYILNDVLTEVYGFKRTKNVIWFAFLANLLFVLASLTVQALPSAPFWQAQQAYETILGFAPRLLVASFSAFLIGAFANSFVLSRLKVATQGKHLWMRTIGSTVVGEGLDSLLFVLIAFYGVLPNAALPSLILTQWVLKTLYEALATPLTYAVVNYVKRIDRTDEYDKDYSLFS